MNDTALSSITHRRVLKIAAPIVISNATVPILGVVDTGVVGQLGLAAPIGAVGVGAITIAALYWIFGFLRMGTTGLASQAFGAGDADETSALLTRALLLSGAFGLGLIMLQVPIFWAAFKLAPASVEVENLAHSYLAIRIWSAPAAIAIYGLSGWLIAQERTRAVLVIQLLMNGLNISLDFAFVLGFGWGVSGVAVASLIAEWSGLLVGLWLCRDGFRGGRWLNWSRVLDRARLRTMAVVNRDIMLRSVLLQAGFLSFLYMGASFGDTTLAANQILLQFLYVTSYALDGFAFAAEALVGQAMGAQLRLSLRRAAVLTGFWGALTAVALAFVFALAGGDIVAIMARSVPVQTEAARYLPWMVLAPLVGVASWMLDGIFIGATRSRDMRNAMAQSFVIYVAVLAVAPSMLGNHGLWLSLLVFFAVRGVTLALRYRSLEAAANSA